MDIQNRMMKQLNSKDRELRLEAVKELKQAIDKGLITAVPRKKECNNHVHSQYSFSPYSPSKIAWEAYETGLSTCGIVDHESVAGCLEFREACMMLGVMPTIGFEVRLNWDDTPLAGRVFNNPDQKSIGYFPIHGVPVSALESIESFLVPIRMERKKRNIKMVEKVDKILSNYGLSLNFEEHVIPISNWQEKGSITERHILRATAKRILEKYEKGTAIIEFLMKKMGINLSEKAKEYLLEVNNPYYDFDVTNILKGFFSDHMYIEANQIETPSVVTTIPFLIELGCIPTYTYLGDVIGESVTGDKKPQKFEDDILDDIFKYLWQYGMRGMSYAPSRNQKFQVERVHQLCQTYKMIEICGEDINQPRQSFINATMTAAEKARFDDATWAIIGHEIAADKILQDGILFDKAIQQYPDMQDRIQRFKKIAVLKDK